ncbi:hypothetical protein MU9_2919 [Morganella morganii subsp. morganii KT]|uniref:Uncharacterized protein n=1 Tax=Morganella morganii subsp. morganii KT TaxID=1124991 RepID=M1SC21_MORMO|nr:hypothetical protein [Morganella morganii]AGG31964.1 hypothetical protein MU9_2919 [Morganella morganii subsp. morganii KT]
MTEKTQKLKPHKLPDEIRRTIAEHPVFVEVVEECLATDEFVEQFQRLYNVSLPRKSSNPLVDMVDETTGFKESQTWEFLSHFVPFVHRWIWLPLHSEGKL